MFLTLEDETEIVNAVARPSLFERQRRVLMTASITSIHSKIQRKGEVVPSRGPATVRLFGRSCQPG